MILVDKKQENLLHHWFDLIKMTRGNSTLNPALNQLMNLNPTKSLNPLKKKNSWIFFFREETLTQLQWTLIQTTVILFTLQHVSESRREEEMFRMLRM